MGGTISRIASIALFFAVLSLSIFPGQSGRKPEKPSNSTPPATTATPGGSSSGSSTTTDSAKVPILVADDGLSNKNSSAKAMLENFVDRLNDTRTTSPSYIGVFKKSQAISRAKTETSGWVLYVDIKVCRFGLGGVNYSDPDMMFNYAIYKAGSDQEVAKGKVKMRNLNNIGIDPLGLPLPDPDLIKTTPEETGRAAADQVMVAIQFNSRPTH